MRARIGMRAAVGFVGARRIGLWSCYGGVTCRAPTAVIGDSSNPVEMVGHDNVGVLGEFATRARHAATVFEIKPASECGGGRLDS